MFQRDSQFTQDSQLSPHNEPPAKSPTPINPAQANASHIRPPLSCDIPPLVTERAQSWQIAPNLFTSFRYAWAGISYAFKTQRNFRVHTGVGIIAILLCWSLHIPRAEVAIICLTIGAVLVMEILNTALESLVDLTVGQTYHELAKIAKDCAAGAVLMAAIVALLIAILIFAKPLWVLFS